MLSVLLFFFAWVGHGYLLMLALNVVYAQPYNRTVLKLLRTTFGFLFAFGPPLFAFFCGWNLVDLAATVPAAYAWLCVAAGAIAFPAITFIRLLRRPPAIVLAEQTEMVDVVAALGGRPVGDGTHRRVAGWTVNDIFNVEFTTLTLAVPGLPRAWDGLTLLHLSDLHFYGTPARSYFEHIVQRCMADGPPDLLVLSGDIIDADKYLDWIAPVLEPLRWKVAAFAVLGNHDWWQDADGVRDRLAALGMRVLGNRWDVLDVRGEPLVAIGHEGPWFRPAPDLTGCPAGFRLLVSHTPDNIGWAKRNGVGLMLSGHNHGGQIRLPIVGSLFVPSAFSRRYDMGTFHEPPTVLHVNRGLSGKEPIRFRCRPQVTRLVLQSATQQP